MKGARQSTPGTMSAIKDAHVVKIAVEMDEQVPQLITFDQQLPLTAIIQDLCNTWALAEPEQYSLQFSDNARSYITEKNRNDIKNGYVLRLTHSPAKTAQDILDKLHSNKPDDMRAALERLQRLSSDYTFALEFINKQGHQLLINMVEAGTYTGDHLALTLQSFVELMDHGIVFWDILEPKFVGRVANQVLSAPFVVDRFPYRSATDAVVCHASRAILREPRHCFVLLPFLGASAFLRVRVFFMSYRN